MASKEALEKISTKQVAIELFNIVSNGKYDMNDLVSYFDRIDKALTELEALKRYPTADEVCKTLSDFYKEKVSYSNERHNHMFYLDESKLGVLRFMNNGVYFIQSDYHKTNLLPPHLITLIGRFYEGLEKEK